MLIGYARVSTEDQTPLPQAQILKAAGCAEIHEEHALVVIEHGSYWSV